jgi:hypothetical protein
MVRVTENRQEATEKERGLFSYLLDQVEFVPFLTDIQLKNDLIFHSNAICWSTIRCPHCRPARSLISHCHGLTTFSLSSFPSLMNRPTSTPSSNLSSGRFKHFNCFLSFFVFNSIDYSIDRSGWD